MFPANVIAPSPIYQSWFRAPMFQQKQQQQLQPPQTSVMRHPGYMMESLLPRTENNASPPCRDVSDPMASEAAAAMAAAQAAFLAAASAATDGDGRQAFNMYRYHQYHLHQQHLQTRTSLATMSLTTPQPQATPRHLATTPEAPDAGDTDDTAVDLVHKTFTSSSPSSSSSVSKSSTPRLKFSVSAILSSEISPRNRKGEDVKNDAKSRCKYYV